MGIDRQSLEFLIDARASGVRFGNTITLGRQDLLVEYDAITSLFREYGIPFSDELISGFYTRNNQFSEPLIEYLGATICQSMDCSDFEDASIVHDLNKSIDASLVQKFDTVIDGGTLEHVFNFPQAMANCMSMVKVGGHFISITPTNNFMGHGFYQFSPELFYRVLSEENGFMIRKMVFCELENGAPWYEVADPNKAAHRVGTTSTQPCYLMLVAEKIAHMDTYFLLTPQQSDYANEWTNKTNKGGELDRLWFWEGKTTSSRRSMRQRIFSGLKFPLRFIKRYVMKNIINKDRDLYNKNLFVPLRRGGARR